MSKIRTKLFLAAALTAAVATPVSAAGIADFVGTWTNGHPQLDGISQIVVKQTGSTLTVSATGNCTPPATCSLGPVDAVAYAPTAQSTDLVHTATAVIAIFAIRDETVQLILGKTKAGLNVESFTWYHGVSSTNYWVLAPFH